MPSIVSVQRHRGRRDRPRRPPSPAYVQPRPVSTLRHNGLDSRAQVGGGSFVIRFKGFAARSFNASCTGRSSCTSRPAATSFGLFSTSMSGPAPSFSSAHLLFSSKNPPRSAIAEPPLLISNRGRFHRTMCVRASRGTRPFGSVILRITTPLAPRATSAAPAGS